MLDRTIPFYNAILRSDSYELQHILIPEECQIVTYQPGFEKDWAKMEYKAGDFDSEEEASSYFCEKYCLPGRSDDVLFLRIGTGQVIGSCIAWTDERNNAPVNSLNWLIVDDEYQGKGYGRLLCTATMNRFCHIRRDCQRRGYAGEAAKAVRDWAFSNTDYPALYSCCKYTNVPSIKTAESIGMRFVCEYPDVTNGTTHVSSISRKEWQDEITENAVCRRRQ